MARLCIGEDDEEDAPLIYKPRRFSERASESVQRFRSWVVAEEDDELNPAEPNSPEEEEDDGGELEGQNQMEAVLTDCEVFDCPICLHQLFTPVFQCENGHIACFSCCSKVKGKCPFCCMPIGISDSRCRGLEKLIQTITISCQYAHHGCNKRMAFSNKSEHEQTCSFVTCVCPHPSCTLADSSAWLYRHFNFKHKTSITRFTYNTTFSVSIEVNQKQMFLQEQGRYVVFILSHVLQERGRAFYVDCRPKLIKK